MTWLGEAVVVFLFAVAVVLIAAVVVSDHVQIRKLRRAVGEIKRDETVREYLGRLAQAEKARGVPLTSSALVYDVGQPSAQGASATATVPVTPPAPPAPEHASAPAAGDGPTGERATRLEVPAASSGAASSRRPRAPFKPPTLTPLPDYAAQAKAAAPDAEDDAPPSEPTAAASAPGAATPAPDCRRRRCFHRAAGPRPRARRTRRASRALRRPRVHGRP